MICAAGALMVALGHGYTAQDSGATQGAATGRPIAERWRDLIESGKYGESWDALSIQAKEKITRAQWIAYLEGKRKPLGATKLREPDGDRYFKSLPGFPNHEGMVFQYQVFFLAAGPVAESVGLILEKDGTWKPQGYLLNTDNVFKGTTEDYYKLGNTFYLQNDYKTAIEMYAKALEREKRTPSLEKDHRRVLIDNLGMSYGLLHDYRASIEIFEYGISTDGSYPNFYYNLACNHAEQGRLAEAIRYLEMAFDRKANLIPGEKMPDPASDPSFASFLSNPEFQKALKRLTGR
jgi:tetratricopeptide (TPR) repeat protein